MSSERISNKPKGDPNVLASNRDSVEMGQSTPQNYPDGGDQEFRLGGGANGPNSANERDTSEASRESSSDTKGAAQVERSQSSSPADTPNSDGREGEGGNASLYKSDHDTPTAALHSSHQPQPTSGVQTFVHPRRCTSAPPRLPGYDPEPRRPTDDDFLSGSTLFADESNRAFEEDSSERAPRLRFPQTYADKKKAWQLWIAKARRNKEKRLRVWWWCGISRDTIDDLMVVPASLVKRRAQPRMSKSLFLK